MADLPQVNAKQIELMKTIANGEKDKPVFMLNLNCYTPEAGYPNGTLYKNYMNVFWHENKKDSCMNLCLEGS